MIDPDEVQAVHDAVGRNDAFREGGVVELNIVVHDRLPQVIKDRAEFFGRNVFVGNYSLQHEAAVGSDVSKELTLAKFVVVRQQPQQCRSG